MSRPTKRSRAALALLAGASATALAGCDEPRDLTFFETADQCVSAASFAEFTPEDCATAFAAATLEHATQAPRYESLALCEEQHGAGACGRPEEAGGAADPASAEQAVVAEGGEPAQAGGGSSFMPFIAGYMMGNMLSSANTAPSYAGRPLYRDAKTGSWFSSNGKSYAFTRPGQSVSGYPSAIRPVATARPAPVMTRAAVAKAGGFGAARASFGGARGFGGFGG